MLRENALLQVTKEAIHGPEDGCIDAAYSGAIENPSRDELALSRPSRPKIRKERVHIRRV